MAMSFCSTLMYCDALAILVVTMDRPLMLMQQRDGVNQREILVVITTQPGFGVGEGELWRVRIADRRADEVSRCAF